MTAISAALLGLSRDFREPFYRLSQVGNIRFGQFVRPGSLLKVYVRLLEESADGFRFEGRIEIGPEGSAKALSAEWVLVPVAVSAGHGRSIAADLKAGGVDGALLVAT